MGEIISRRNAFALTVATGGILFALDNREPAGRFKAKSLDGELFSNESTAGKVVLLQFWATWCPYCRSDQPAVEALAQEFKRDGLIVLAVDVGESKKKVKQYLEASPRSSKIVLTEDTNLAAWYAAKTYPYYVLIDQNGRIAGTQKGAGGESSLRRLLAKAGLRSD
jgi:thiol-disulfide isomerase/thioredoxin